MICRWCGKNIPDGKIICPSCGKEQPPLSDCGGFYNLVPKAKNLKAQAATPQPEIRPQGQEVRQVSKKQTPQQRLMAFLPLIILLAASLTALLVSVIGVASAKREIRKLEEVVSELQEDKAPSATEPSIPATEDTQDASSESAVPSASAQTLPTEPNVSVATEPTVDPNTPLAPKDYSAEAITMDFPCDAQKPVAVPATVTSGQADIRGEVQTSAAGTTWTSTATCYAANTQFCTVKFVLSNDAEQTVAVNVEYDLTDNTGFGAYEEIGSNIDLQWRYVGETAWQSSETNNTLVSPGEKTAQAAPYTVNLQKNMPLAQGRDKIELRALVNRASKNGGSLSFTIGTAVIDLKTGMITYAVQ